MSIFTHISVDTVHTRVTHHFITCDSITHMCVSHVQYMSIPLTWTEQASFKYVM